MAEIKETTNEARQGPKGKPVFYVLIASLVLAGLYLAAMMTWSGSQTSSDINHTSSTNGTNQSNSINQGTSRTSGETDRPAGTSSSNSGNVKPENPAYPAPSSR